MEECGLVEAMINLNYRVIQTMKHFVPDVGRLKLSVKLKLAALDVTGANAEFC